MSILELKNISKVFPGVQALEDVTINIEKGETHSIVGENGAGKSTLMNIIMGVYNLSKGEIKFNNKNIRPNNPREAQNLGIGIVPQELNLIPNLSVAENMTLGTEHGGFFKRLNWKEKYNIAEKYIDILEIDVDIKKKIKNISPAQQQLIQIARSLVLDCQIVILDEPTTALTMDEINILFNIIKKLKEEENKTFIFISHKLEEVFEISDRISVLRDGKHIITKNIEQISKSEVVKYMVGREVRFDKESINYSIKDENILEVKNFTCENGIKNVDLNVKKGEIVGLAGLVGAGRSELAKGLFGVSKKTTGNILINNEKIEYNTPNEAIKLGLGLIPEERIKEGLLRGLSVKQNLTLPILDKLVYKLNFIDRKKEDSLVENYINKFNIKTPDKEQKIAFLSGGNQQKVVLARWIAKKCDIIIFDEPTKGIDIGAKSEIHNIIIELANEGKGVIIISSEFPELFYLTNRMYILKNKKIIAEYNSQEVNQETILNKILEKEDI